MDERFQRGARWRCKELLEYAFDYVVLGDGSLPSYVRCRIEVPYEERVKHGSRAEIRRRLVAEYSVEHLLYYAQYLEQEPVPQPLRR